MTKKTKTLEYYLELPYKIVIVRDVSGKWFVEVPLLSGCMSQGDTIIEAAENIIDAMMAWLECGIENRVNIPEPGDLRLTQTLEVVWVCWNCCGELIVFPYKSAEEWQEVHRLGLSVDKITCPMCNGTGKITKTIEVIEYREVK